MDDGMDDGEFDGWDDIPDVSLITDGVENPLNDYFPVPIAVETPLRTGNHSEIRDKLVRKREELGTATAAPADNTQAAPRESIFTVGAPSLPPVVPILAADPSFFQEESSFRVTTSSSIITSQWNGASQVKGARPQGPR